MDGFFRILKFKPKAIDAVILFLSVIFAYAANALMDAIMVVKAGRALDLEHLWHGSKYFWAAMMITAGGFIMRHLGWLLFERHDELKKERPVLIRFLVAIVGSAIIGFVLWDVLYKTLKQIPWHQYPWA